MELDNLNQQAAAIAQELIALAGLEPGQILVVGCSTSEVRGEKIGTAGSDQVAASILDNLITACRERGLFLAIQCCEHLNRALVVEKDILSHYPLEPVSVVPVPHAGGALAAQAIKCFRQPVVVETIQAHAGLDIGSTLIGMHLKRVAVPLRLTEKYLGQAYVTAAKTRPKLIGGARAIYGDR
ncbi:TIGR01440 family protein [Acetonema longum]|uniref:UPF0340 protein ALO_09844 n=1 Tax=Acetonema longum DSM 6540 TaxID=1009370 RepID=F7NIR6_9FIRM|nr:TIGR01440 family protein [Acetonema longum]EGO64039.1 hypothetical protein ALO_09844 [Acetonema longum DSM 6540]